jgi:Ca2+-binding EF-hand superfamily protein
MEITFKQFDKDSSGTISKDEFFEVCGGLRGNSREFMIYFLGFDRRAL